MLKELELENFRNYSQLKLEFNAARGITYLIGDNGQGKTNLLEAIYVLAITKSFRVSDIGNLIKRNAPFSRIKCLLGNKNTRDTQLEVFFSFPPQPGKVCKINGVKTSTGAFVGKFKVVLFHPEDLNMFYLGPDLRRRYLDILLSQKNRHYFEALRRFHRLKEQRNALLSYIHERRANESQLIVWDEQIVPEAVFLWQKRVEALGFIQKRLSAQYSEIAGKATNLDLTYQNSIGLSLQQALSNDEISKLCFDKFFKSRQRDILSSHTQIGPHRDDIQIALEGIPITLHASRGEFRTILLALKLIEMEYFADENMSPILLLDDVFSELDYERQKFLLSKVIKFQTFITTTKDSAIINGKNLISDKILEILNGEVKEHF